MSPDYDWYDDVQDGLDDLAYAEEHGEWPGASGSY